MLRIARWLVFGNFLLFALGQSLSSAEVPAPSPCKDFEVKVQEKSEAIRAQREAAEDLLRGLHGKQSAEVPLNVLFRVPLESEVDVAGALAALKESGNTDYLLQQGALRTLADCAVTADQKRELNVLAASSLELNNLKIEFLRLPLDDRLALIATYESARKQLQEQTQINAQLDASKATLAKAQTELTRGEQESTKIEASEDLATARMLLDRYLVEVESEQISYIESIKKQKESLSNVRQELTRLQATLGTAQLGLNEQFQTADDIWSNAFDHLLEIFSKGDVNLKSDIPGLMPRPDSGEPEEKKEAYAKYESEYQKAAGRRRELVDSKSRLLSDLKAQGFRLLSDAGFLRARLIRECQAGSCPSLDGMNKRVLLGYAREIRVLPLKFLAGGINKLTEFKAKIGAGFEAWLDLARQISILVFLLFLPFLVYRFLSWISARLDRLRSSILARSIMDYRRRTHVAMWISRLNPFVPSAGMIVSIHLARKLIEATDLREISFLLFYLEVYFLYRASRILLRIALEFFFSHRSLQRARERSLKAELTAQRLTMLFFAQYALLHLIEDTVRKALVYGTVSKLVFLISSLLVIIEIRNWREEIFSTFQSRFPKFSSSIGSLLERRFSSLLLPPMILAIVVGEISNRVLIQLVKFDFFKQLLSDIFRRKLEKAELEAEEFHTPDSKYLSYFDYYLPAKQEFFVERDPTTAGEILRGIQGWLQGEISDDLVILSGYRGIGKTTNMSTILGRIQHPHKKMAGVPAKICDSEELYQWLSGLAGREIKSVRHFLEYDQSLGEKQVFLVDDIHNLFLARIGGFQCYRLFNEIVALQTKNIFWCLSVNNHAWEYLRGVFGEEHFYGKTYEMRMWTDAEIQNLIMARHHVTGYGRSFDRSIMAYGAHNVLGEQVETQFFRLLWGQSRGNPRSALMYWVSAISQPSGEMIHVGVPKFIESALVGAMSDNAHLLLAAIARHDSLTFGEMMEVTGVDGLVVRKCLKEALDLELLWMDDKGRYRISSRAQNAIDYFLIGKNFLYE